jgi:hypothetical protein
MSGIERKNLPPLQWQWDGSRRWRALQLQRMWWDRHG